MCWYVRLTHLLQPVYSLTKSTAVKILRILFKVIIGMYLLVVCASFICNREWVLIIMFIIGVLAYLTTGKCNNRSL